MSYSLAKISDEQFPKTRPAMEMAIVQTSRANARGALLATPDPEKREEWRRKGAELEKLVGEFDRMNLADSERQGLSEINRLHKEYQQKGEEVITLANDNIDEASKMSDEVLGKLDNITVAGTLVLWRVEVSNC